MTNEKHFSKTISQCEFDYDLFTNLPTIIAARNFLRIHSNSKEVSYLSWQNMYLNVKTTCHIELNFFLWTKLLKNLLLAKYFTSIVATLKILKNLAYQKRYFGGGEVKLPIYLKKAEDLLSFATYFWKPSVLVKILFEWVFVDKGG